MQLQRGVEVRAAAPVIGRRARAPRRPPPAAAAAAAGGGGFGAPAKAGKSAAPKEAKQPKLARYLGEGGGGAGSAPGGDDGWFQVPGVDAVQSFVSKPIKAVILPVNNRAIVLVRVDDRVYCTDAASTAFKYPLADAALLRLKNGRPALETALDGTVYDLETGAVVTWCPKNTLARKVLGTLKDKEQPVDLPVYPCQVRGSEVWVKLV